MTDKRPRRASPPRGPEHELVHLDDEIVRELRATVRPGKAEIAIKVFSEAAGAFVAEDYDEAIRLAEQTKHMALRAAAPRELLGLAYYRVERYPEAARELSTFRRLSGSAEQNPVIADCYRAMDKPERALELLDEVSRDRVDAAVYFEAQIVAAGALTDIGRTDDAIARLDALDLQPQVAEEHHVRAWYVLADLLEKRGRFSQALTWFEAAAANAPDLTDAADRAGRLKKRS